MLTIPEGVVLSVGNPLLDIVARVDQNFLEKWCLKNNDAVLCNGKQTSLFEELTKLDPICVPGGVVQNTALVFQKIIGHERRFCVLGSVGTDEDGKLLEEKLRDAGVEVSYKVRPESVTGKCAVLVNGTHRSLCTLLAASREYTLEDLKTEVDRIQRAQFFYLSGFFLNTCPEIVTELARISNEQGKTFIFNLGAPFVLERHKDLILSFMNLVDVVFGNKEEALTFAKLTGFASEDLREIALALSSLLKTSSKPRLVIITQAEYPILVASCGKVEEIDPVHVSQEEVVDTNGAGDAFVGGFLAHFVQNHPIKVCVKGGSEAAAAVIRSVGCCTSKLE